eukprot:8249893-Pyramimonas_sp.AAC.1
MEKARGAPLQPAPGTMQRRRSALSPKDSQPGTCQRIAALPGGGVKFTSRGASSCPCTSAYAMPRKNASSTSTATRTQSGRRATSEDRAHCDGALGCPRERLQGASANVAEASERHAALDDPRGLAVGSPPALPLEDAPGVTDVSRARERSPLETFALDPG